MHILKQLIQPRNVGICVCVWKGLNVCMCICMYVKDTVFTQMFVFMKIMRWLKACVHFPCAKVPNTSFTFIIPFKEIFQSHKTHVMHVHQVRRKRPPQDCTCILGQQARC
jgi:hypothetical protein